MQRRLHESDVPLQVGLVAQTRPCVAGGGGWRMCKRSGGPRLAGAAIFRMRCAWKREREMGRRGEEGEGGEDRAGGGGIVICWRDQPELERRSWTCKGADLVLKNDRITLFLSSYAVLFSSRCLWISRLGIRLRITRVSS